MSGSLRAYLARYAEADAEIHAGSALGNFGQALVVPLYDEADHVLDDVLRHYPGLLGAGASAETPLVIAVVNAPCNASRAALRHSRRLFRHLTTQARSNLLVVDRVSSGRLLPARQGVGLARKLGSDIALHLYAQGRLASPWIFQTDADATLPPGYFEQPLPDQGTVVLGHHHASSDPLLQRAARLYEWHMAYYHTSLARLGSRYAYPTLGSTVIVHAQAYAAVRGFPKRDAAEDFYLLNKLAKVAPVYYRPQLRVSLQARTSHRVPFGTGPALQTIAAGLQHDPSGGFYDSYHPASFTLLGQALRYLEQAASQPDLAPPTRAGLLLDELGLAKVAQSIARQYPKPQRRLGALTDWFDAKRTLRFIHQARRFFPDQPLLQTLRALPADQQNRIGFTPGM